MSLLNEFSIQLYSVRQETEKDFFGVLEKLGKIGYTGVEFAGYGDIKAQDMKKAMDASGIKSIGAHEPLELMKSRLGFVLTYNSILESQYIIVPHASFSNRDEALKLAEILNDIGEKCMKEGFKFAYHNHSHEFAVDGGEYLLDIVMNNVDPSKVFLELDLYWAAYAGVDPLEYMKKMKGSIKLLHIKQIKDYETRKCVDLDEGVIDFKTIIETAKANGVEHFVLEQEEFAVSPFVSVEKGYKHIMSL